MALVSWSPFSSRAPPERRIALARKTSLGLRRRSRAGWEMISLPLTKVVIELLFSYSIFFSQISRGVVKCLKIIIKSIKKTPRQGMFNVFLEQLAIDPTCSTLST